MAERDSEMSPVLQELLRADNEDKIWVSTNKISKMRYLDFFKLVEEKVMVIFNTEDHKNPLMDNNIIMDPEDCADPYIRLELMCFKYIFRNQFNDYAYTKMEECVFTAISEIDVDNYISSIQGSLFNSHAIINMLKMIQDNRNVANNTVNKNPSVLQVECNAKLLDLLAQAILVDIRCIFFEKISDVCLVFKDIVHFVDIYNKIREDMLDVNLKNHPLQTESIRSALTAISKWILILEAKLLHSRFNSSIWSVMINKIENLRKSMVMDFKHLCSGLSLQVFLREREYAGFYADYPDEPYTVTNDIKQLNTGEISTDENPYSFELIYNDLMEHYGTMYCISFKNVPIRGIEHFYADEESSTSYENEDTSAEDEDPYTETNEER